MTIEARTDVERQSREICDLMDRRSAVFFSMEREEDAGERDRLFAYWQTLTRRIQELQA